ncbi:MAG TPA: dihydrodipicolinate synthase family protein [Caldilineae bacterium]|nr:dihydrodipicolinate synthase family protein [Caldilineae bacterium]
MKTELDIRGVICPIVTSFDDQNRVDFEGVRRVVDFLLSHQIDGLMVGGTTGEGMLLSIAERKALCEAVVEHVDGRVPVIAHTGCISTAETIELTCHARATGAIAASVIVPYFFTLDDESLYMHFTAVARAVPDFPIFLYTFPGNAKNDITPALLERLLEAAPNIIGIKSSNPSLIRLQEYIHIGGDGFQVFCGVDGLMLPALVLGARAQVSGNSNVFPEIFRELYEAFESGHLERAQALQCLINQIRSVFKDGITPAYFKAGLKLRGVPAGCTRPPMRELEPEELKAVEKGLRALELI